MSLLGALAKLVNIACKVSYETFCLNRVTVHFYRAEGLSVLSLVIQ